ncbi:hypothetical protein K4L04_08195 [Phaeobacter inhibens]|uniref:hypothetical protein n=1 Tax=Phaeobacter inhibens TaxID=221822 RepID=UPI0021A842ED|nr:hypothetical protein [Phaeobacter inhibens]UWR77913.1 hypothetical protein K4L04_08195 [Phaeobacter inhibens]
MISALLSRFWGCLVAAGAILAAIWTYLLSRDAGVRKETYIETLEDSVKRKEAGREAVEDLRGNSRDDDIEQLRRNSDRW